MKEVRDQIYRELQNVTAKTAENVFDAIQSEEGYKMVEDLIIKMMVNEQLSISGCIPHLDEMI